MRLKVSLKSPACACLETLLSMKAVGSWPCCISFEAICLTPYFAREMR
ncbi:hypothetical protein-signal peptide prediction [Rhodopirellula baltica SH 1]|uniref:Uncharacterized protein n=1 Tax=Rhodopirellula baltica (strain DSM 10527 / NCIMB 13988 / SH1) TaxID=243090 RepID=Q7UUV3_RHOBA|nr:hypothetical protein-signal peptide prediction [Rhodopirellula baltica SH 1]